MTSDFHKGLTFWYRGWAHLFKNRSLLAVAFVPVVIAIAFAVGFVYLMFSYLPLWVHALITSVVSSSTGIWYDLVYYPLVLGGGLVVFIASLYISLILLRLVAVPFYSVLAERTLNQLGKKTNTSWRTMLSMFRASLIKTFWLMLIGVILFVFSFVPILNLLAITCALFIMAWDCIDYVFEAQGLSLGQRTAYLWRERWQWAGMAMGLALTLPVPGLTLLVFPGAVVGSALIVKERE